MSPTSSNDDLTPDLLAPPGRCNSTDAGAGRWVWELRSLAQREAVRALERYSQDDPDAEREVAIAVGAATEYLHTAVIATVDPVLLAAPQNLPSMLMLSRHNREWVIEPRELRTADMSRKIDLVQRMFPEQDVKADAVTIASYRNAAVHAGLTRDGAAPGLLQRMVRVIDKLDPLVGKPANRGFWPDQYAGTVQHFRDEAASAVARLVEARLESARARFQALTAGLDSVGVAAVAGGLEIGARGRAPELAREHRCPACQRSGWISYTRSTTFPTVQGGDVGELETVGVPMEFDCGVCGLYLGPDLIREFRDMRELLSLDEETDWSLIEPDEYPYWEPGEDEESR